MTLVLNPFALPGFLAMLAAFALGAFLTWGVPASATTRLLALSMALDGIVAGAGTGFMFATDSYADAFAWQGVTTVAFAAVPFAYLCFLATLPSRFARVLRWARVPAAILLALTWLLFFLRPRAFYPGLAHPPAGYAPWDLDIGMGFTILVYAVGLFALVGLVVVIDIFRHAPRGSEERRQASALVIAFGARDMIFLLGGVIVPLVLFPLLPATDVGTVIALDAALPQTATLLYVPLVGYGILRAHLFDIDVKLRWTVRRGTLAAVFIAVFFVVAQLAQNYLATSYGWAAGGVVAGLLLFALTPLQRMAERVAEAAVPAARTTPEYLAFRKIEVYQVTVEGMLEAGPITHRERAILERLRAKLALNDVDARAVEHDLLAQRSSGAVPVRSA